MLRTFLHFLTLVFVVVSIYVVVKNNHVPEIATQYFKNAETEVGKLVQGLPGMFPLPTSTDTAHTTSGSLSKIVLPGPLSKILPTTNTSKSVSSGDSAGTLTVQGIIHSTNSERGKQSLAALHESSALDASAKVKATDILKRQYFEHTAPDGRTVSDLVADQGYSYIKIGENLALGNFKDDADVVTAWMGSPGHRANILDGEYTQIGVGVAYGMYQGRMVSVAVQHFGRPRSDCPTISDTLKAQVEGGQAELTSLSETLKNLKAAIDQGNAEGKDMSQSITVYNQGVEKYQSEYTRIDALRVQYNAEVDRFNSCIGSSK